MSLPRVRKRHYGLVSSIFLCLITVVFGAVTTTPCDRSRKVYTESYGIITDGPTGSNYTQDSHCEWLIKAKNESQFITLKFRSMGTECSYDYVFVYDGDSYQAPLLGSFSGKTEPPQILATSGHMLILLYSDTNYVLDGFKAEFSVHNCPNNCSNQGICTFHTCVCSGNWGGRDCSIELCPKSCSNQGICQDGKCKCMKGYSGVSCSLDSTNPNVNTWHWLSYSNSGGLTPRAAHAAVYINHTDSLYVFGGYNLNNVLGSLQIYRFEKSHWEDEYGNVIKDQSANEFDPNLLPEFLKQGDLNKWGVNEGSFLNHLLQSAFTRKYRSPPRYASEDDPLDMDISTTESFLNSSSDKSHPSPRYGHAACQISSMFILYGGKLGNGHLSNELWGFNVLTKKWSLRATNSTIRPPALTRHTVTAVEGEIYVFGGSTADGEFSSRMFKINLTTPDAEQWEEVLARGGKELDVRVVAHTAVYHYYSHAIIVYGGIIAGVARFSKLSDKMFAFDIKNRLWSEIHYPRAHLRDSYVPRERAFHSATVVGNYLVVFGGYSHRHNKEEICYDNQMYLYHLGCHSWTSGEILGVNGGSKYPKSQGVFAHAAALRPPSTLLLVGGYHGNVNGDLLAFVIPGWLGGINTLDPEAACPRHHSHAECLADPECGWCSADEVCYGRTVGSNCTTNLQSVRCGGICPALGDCHSCLTLGTTRPDVFLPSISTKLGLHHCTWCVQNARCHHKDDNYGVCGEDTPSQGPGWWGDTGTEITRVEECRSLDRRPGLTFIKYLHPPDPLRPDHVAIINATTVDFNAAGGSRVMDVNNGVVAVLKGYLHLPPTWENIGEMLRVCAGHARVELFLGDNQSAANLTTELSHCIAAVWPSLQPGKLAVELHAYKSLTNGHFSAHQQSKMELQHNRSHENAKAFTFEYLEPYSNGTCSQYHNCLHCLTDSECGWCELTDRCLSRSENEMVHCALNGDWRFLTLQPAFCSNCSNYISCSKCAKNNCEWWVEDARCGRKGRLPGAVKLEEECPQPCHTRTDCSTCLDERGRCVWCEATQQCFSFSVYTSEYQFGLCREWLDRSAASNSPSSSLDVGHRYMDQCKSCSQSLNCSSCLQSLSCGWCYSRENPIKGACVQGDFGKPLFDCGGVLNISLDEAQWAYAQCPDVDECGLGLHDCHPKATCTNTHGSYSCKCLRGFIGDGRTSCTQTCYNNCVHGYCLGAPEFVCHCDLGWTGADCALNCGCNNHSTCNNGVGICDQCQDWTEGEFCDKCKIGSYGNATTSRGCRKCDCNGHGDEELGICDVQTGVCFCKDNTEGLNCEKCSGDFYGDPRHGARCFYQCEARAMLYDNVEQGLGSHKAHAAAWGGPPVQECLWIISPKNISSGYFIQLTINTSRMSIPCADNSVYVYDGLPDLGKAQQSQLIGVFCNDASPITVESRSGHMTVHYKQGFDGQGFEAVYKVLGCDSQCPLPRLCKNNQCVCPDGFTGLDCKKEICPGNCSSVIKQGACDKAYGRCICAAGWGGSDCSEKIQPFHLVFTQLFDSQNLADSLDHLRKNLPRFGHSLVTDKRGSLWMFGGYSLSHGPLNDIRLFDTKNSTWMQVTLEATPEAKMPEGRYFHAAEIVHSKQAIYIHGGLGDQNSDGQNRILDDFWQFSLKEQRWNSLSALESRPPGLTGHTLTLQKNQVGESLLLIGGFDLDHGFNADVWEFDLSRNKWEIMKTEGSYPVGLYGHSTVYHAPTQSFYVYGGIVFSNHLPSPSNKLLSLNMRNKRWSELPTFPELNFGGNLPRARFLHSAVTTEDYMLVFGGRTQYLNTSDALSAYVYNCNQWVQLASDVVVIGDIPPPVYAHAMTLDPDSGALYVMGGWAGAARSTVTKVTLPLDICRLWSGGKHTCRHHMGCSFCTVYPQGGSNSTHCHSIGRSEVCNSHNGTLITNNGAACDDILVAGRSCSNFTSCTSCLANWPAHPTILNLCQWCSFCGKGMCIPAGHNCASITKCDIYPLTITDPHTCPSKICEATDCNHCPKDKCIYTQQVLVSNEGSVKMTSTESIYDWTCVSKEAVAKVNPKIRELTTCPAKCHSYKDCRSCLRSEGAEGGHPECYWATHLNLCLAPSYQFLYCAGGVCGLVLHQKQIEQCPSSCYSFTQCSECLKHAHCGWCSLNSTAGDGVCTEGSLDSPADHPLHSTCRTIYEHQKKVDLPPNETLSWNYILCPPENECENGHHSCNPESERCEDLPSGYECVCGPGYRAAGDSCVPVCTQGCVRGSCVRPDVCKCDFGYVGSNCSIQCQCNGHSECQGPDKLNICLECHNNTMGNQCEKCKPQFVGDPTDNGQCVPCLTYCYGHSESCSSDWHNSPTTTPESLRHSLSSLETYLVDGPNGNIKCDKCTNYTEGLRCEKCIPGYFRGTENLRDACRKCQCHGHGDMCDPVTGEKCNCGNNTESDATCQTSSSSKNSAQECWRYQCVKCKESYMGDPKNGHQCYRMISADNRLCFDGKLIDECKTKSSMLSPGQTVYFVIIPKFMNVDIRVTIDVTQGALDIFMSPNEMSFVVSVNSTTGEHHVDLDQSLLRGEPVESFFSNRSSFDTLSRPRSFFQKVEYTLLNYKADGLISFVTVDKKNTLLWVQGLKNRLILTFPQSAHDLGYNKFYLVLKALGSEEGVTRPTQGLIFFRQDQLHIDLFVFFSVFFSCFFLFLAACVVAWKAKQAADVRRARRRHVVEMLHMAKRPFAFITLILGPQTPPTQRKRVRVKVNPTNNSSEVRPIAVEPTADGIAAVTSILVRLPGGKSAPTRLALASSLVLLGRQMPSSNRTFLRRVHNTPPPPPA